MIALQTNIHRFSHVSLNIPNDWSNIGQSNCTAMRTQNFMFSFFFFRSKTSTWRDGNLKRTRKSGVLERRNKTHKYRLLLASLRLLFSFLRKSLLRGCVRGIASIKHRRVIKHHGFRVCRESAFYISRLCAWSCEIRPWTVSLERKELRSIKFCRRQSRISAVISVEFRKWI